MRCDFEGRLVAPFPEAYRADIRLRPWTEGEIRAFRSANAIAECRTAPGTL